SMCAGSLAEAQNAQYPPTAGAAPAAATGQRYGEVNQVAAVGVGQPAAQAGGVLGQPAAAPNGAPGAPVTPGLPPAPPFQLSEIEKAEVLRLLQMWENSSSKVNTFNTEFERWEYDAVFGPGSDTPLIKATGTLSFSKP